MHNLRNWDNKTWLSSKKYILNFNKFLKSKIKLNKDTKILDIGCGRANIISALQKKYKFKNKPIGIDIVKNKNLKKNIIFRNNDGISYLRREKQKYDLILIKQTIHFFSKNKLNTLLNLSKKSLNSKGILLIFSLVTRDNKIPCFKKMKKKLDISLRRDEKLLKFVKLKLKKVKITSFSYKVNILKKDYIKMLKARYISCLLYFSRKEILKGIDELNLNYKKQISFTDTLKCIAYKK